MFVFKVFVCEFRQKFFLSYILSVEYSYLCTILQKTGVIKAIKLRSFTYINV